MGNINSHLEELRRKHRALDEEILAEERALSACPYKLQKLKRQKLRLKDEIDSSQRLVG